MTSKPYVQRVDKNISPLCELCGGLNCLGGLENIPSYVERDYRSDSELIKMIEQEYFSLVGN